MDTSTLETLAIIITIAGAAWAVRGAISDNSVAIAANAAAIAANAAAIAANAVAIDELSDTAKTNVATIAANAANAEANIAAAIDKLREVVLSGNSAPV